MKTKFARLAQMDHREIAWRSRAAARIAIDRAKISLRPSCWNRRDLLRGIAPAADFRAIRTALEARDWSSAHRAIVDSVISAPARFPIGPRNRVAVAERIHAELPAHAACAIAKANRIVDGSYDLLGYKGLRFGEGASIDWHLDPVHNRKPPREFWADVPFLSPESGDHKIIWELNRHQHWLSLGRAYWLTDDGLYRSAALAQLDSWLEANPPLVGVNWSSMLELAFRSISWIWALNFFAVPETGASEIEDAWTVDLLLALDRQLDQIARHLSCYFSPNTHLLGEALALYVGGLALPQLAASRGRVAIGRRVLIAEIARQIEADGGHCERSTHYHRYALDFYLLALVVARLAGDEATVTFESAVVSLAEAARLLADDQGRLPHLGDDDGGAAFPIGERALDDITDSLEAASALAGRPHLRVGPITEEAMWLLAQPADARALDELRAVPPGKSPLSGHLRHTGYCVSRTNADTHLVMDAGPHGYKNSGHAHADALSLTLSVRSVPLLIDPGTHSYTVEPHLRDRMRSTVLHNTLTLDERSASIPAGPFSWVHAANSRVHRWRTNGRFDYIDASHDGYAPLEHRRHVLALHDDLIVVADLVRGDGMRRADVHWHLDPRWAVHLGAHSAVASARGAEVDIFFPAGDVESFVADSGTGLGWHAPVYGRLEPSTTLRVTRIGTVPLWIASVFGLDQSNRIEHVEILPVWSAAGALQHSFALRITRASTVEHVLIAEPSVRSRSSSWRAGEVETDAAMLIYRVSRDANGGTSELGLVDGSRAHDNSRRSLSVDRPSIEASLFLDRHALAALNQGRPHVRDCRIR